jgi:hypothetical protein
MKSLIILVSLITIFNISAASWTKEVTANNATVKSEALLKVLESFEEGVNAFNTDTYLDNYATVARIKSKKSSESLKNSIKQLYYINSTQWYCDVEVKADNKLVREFNKKDVKASIASFISILDDSNLTYDQSGVDKMSDSFYSLMKKNKLSFMGANIYCNDEYANYTIYSVFDDETNEVLNLSVGFSG